MAVKSTVEKYVVRWYIFTTNRTGVPVSYLRSDRKQYMIQIGMLEYPCGRMIYAVNAGLYAAVSSLLGKLSGIQDYSTSAGLVLKTLLFVLMVACNVRVWTSYVKALQQSTSSLPPTVTSTAVNYISSALLGHLVFGEVTSLLWWGGAVLVLLGLMLICHPHKQHEQ